MRKRRFYKADDGVEYPLTEGSYDIGVKVYRSDKRKSEIGSPTRCIIALGIKRNPDVQEAYIGSGKDAYVIFKPRGGAPARAVHFTIPAEAARVRDGFDTKGAPTTQVINLRAPTPGRTLSYRATLDKRRREEIKNGAPVKSRGRPNTARITRIGVPHRPRPKIIKGVVEMASAPPA